MQSLERGLAVIRAFEEEGLPIDVVGGASIGSFIASVTLRMTLPSERRRSTAQAARCDTDAGIRAWMSAWMLSGVRIGAARSILSA